MDLEQFRVTMDVVVSGSKSLETRREALQAFHEAWFEATRMTIEQPDRAAQAMSRWGNRWTGVGSPRDLRDSLEEFAQATVQDNQAVMAEGSLPLLYERYKEAQSVWRSGGREPRYPLQDAELSQAFDPLFVRKAATRDRPHLHRAPGQPHLPPDRPPGSEGAQPGAAAAPDHGGRVGSRPGALPQRERRPAGRGPEGPGGAGDPGAAQHGGHLPAHRGLRRLGRGKGLDESRVNALAFERARAVQSYVLKYGISADRVGAEHGGAPLPESAPRPTPGATTGPGSA